MWVESTDTDFGDGLVSSVTIVGTGDAAYVQISTKGAVATGGTITYSGGYVIHTFTSNGTFTPNSAMNVEVLVVAGGGGGGGDHAGGGGSGEHLFNNSYAASGNITVTIGGGGAGGPSARGAGSVGGDGLSSVFGTLTAVGGGGGGTLSNGGRNGASGGGGGVYSLPGGTGTKHYNGGSSSTGYGGGGGGGVGGVGGNASVPGDMYANGGTGGTGVSTYSDLLIAANAGVDISGTHWIGGGGGGCYSPVGGDGGIGGGGSGSVYGGAAAVAGTVNTGSGGGGGNSYVDGVSGAGAAGGYGIVIVRYLNYFSTGTYKSNVLDSGAKVVVSSIGWTPSSQPGGTSVIVGVRASSASFTAGSSWPDWVSVINGGAPAITGRYVQYMSTFTTTSSTTTPRIEDITIAYKVKPWQEKTTVRTGNNAFGFGGGENWTWEVPCKGGQLITITAYVRYNTSYGSTSKPKITLYNLGIINSAQMTAGADTWEQLTVSGTPNRDGVLKLKIEGYATVPGAKMYVDDISISQ